MLSIDTQLHKAINDRLELLAGADRAVHHYIVEDLGYGLTVVFLTHTNYDVTRGPTRHTVLIFSVLPDDKHPQLVRAYETNQTPETQRA